jgi:hypothetical protein
LVRRLTGLQHVRLDFQERQHFGGSREERRTIKRSKKLQANLGHFETESSPTIMHRRVSLQS